MYQTYCILSQNEYNSIQNKGTSVPIKEREKEMKQYGAFKATEFSKRQIGVVFAKAKSGALKIEKWFMSELYTLADFYGYDDNGNVADNERDVLAILDAVFANNENAQNIIDETEAKWFSRYGRKTQAKCDRNAFVA